MEIDTPTACTLFLHVPKTGGTSVRQIFTDNNYTLHRIKDDNQSSQLLANLHGEDCKQRVLLEIHGKGQTPTTWREIAEARARELVEQVSILKRFLADRTARSDRGETCSSP